MPQKTLEERRVYMRGYYARNRRHLLDRVKARYQKDKKHILRLARTRYWGRYRDSKIAKTYGISKVEAQKLLGIKACQICGNATRRMTVDHNHKTGKVRGRLCTNCNSGLGQFKDDPDTLRKAARYLVREG